jgi:heme-degrading monooxygenase HmoA
MQEFIPGPENQQLLESLITDVMTVEWLLHINVAHTNLPLPKDGSLSQLPLLSIVRHFIKDGEKDKFERTFKTNKAYLQDFVTEGTIGGAWRVDPKDGKDEWVLLCPWKDVEQHHAFATTDGFVKYGQIREHIAGADIKHAKLLAI